MTNPNNAIGTNAAYGTRTSVDAFNDIAQIFAKRGVVSGFEVVPNGGMTVSVGGKAGVRDVAVAEDNLGNRTMVDNRLGSAVDVVLEAASASSARYSAIVVYVNKPAQAENTTPDAPSVCGIIEVQGSSSGVSEAQIRAAITADGGTGSVAYYAELARVYVGAGSTDITSANISQSWLSFEPADGSITTAKLADGAVATDKVANGAITSPKIDWTTMGFEDRTDDISFDSAISHDSARLYRKGNLCVLFGSVGRSGGFTTGYKNIGVLPADCWPVIFLQFRCTMISNASGLPDTQLAKMRFNDTTGLWDFNTGSNATNHIASFCYVWIAESSS